MCFAILYFHAYNNLLSKGQFSDPPPYKCCLNPAIVETKESVRICIVFSTYR